MTDIKESMTQYEALRSLKGLDDGEAQPKMALARKALKESSSPKEERKALARKGRLGASNQAGFDLIDQITQRWEDKGFEPSDYEYRGGIGAARFAFKTKKDFGYAKSLADGIALDTGAKVSGDEKGLTVKVDLKGVKDEGLKESEGENEFDSTKIDFGGIEAKDAKGYTVKTVGFGEPAKKVGADCWQLVGTVYGNGGEEDDFDFTYCPESETVKLLNPEKLSDFSDEEIKSIKAELLDNLITNFDASKLTEAKGDAKDGYSVTVTEKNSGMPFVIDVWIRGDDVQYDWNQYIFNKYDEGDMQRRTIQSDADVFEAATDAAIDYLEAKGLIAQGEDGKWSYGGGKKEECAKPGSLKESEGEPDMRLDVDEGEISKMPKAIDLRGIAKISPVEGSAGQFDVWATGKCVTPGYVQDELRAKGVKSASVIAYSSKKGLKESDEGES